MDHLANIVNQSDLSLGETGKHQTQHYLPQTLKNYPNQYDSNTTAKAPFDQRTEYYLPQRGNTLPQRWTTLNQKRKTLPQRRKTLHQTQKTLHQTRNTPLNEALERPEKVPLRGKIHHHPCHSCVERVVIYEPDDIGTLVPPEFVTKTGTQT